MANANESGDDDFERLSEHSCSTTKSRPSIIWNQNQETERVMVCSAIYVRSLPPDVSDDEIYEIFQQYGQITNNGITIENNVNNPTVNAIVKFTSPSTVSNILKGGKVMFIRGFKLTIKMYNSSNDVENVFDKSIQNKPFEEQLNQKKQIPDQCDQNKFVHEQTNQHKPVSGQSTQDNLIFEQFNHIESIPDKSNQNKPVFDEASQNKPVAGQTNQNKHTHSEGVVSLTQSTHQQEVARIHASSTIAGNWQRDSNQHAQNEISTKNVNKYVESNVNRTLQWVESVPPQNEEHSSTIQIRNIEKLSSENVLFQYVTNERHSNGGNVEKFIFEKKHDLAIVVYKSHQVAKRVLEKACHTLEGQILYISKLPPICKSQFYFANIPHWVTLETLEMYLEAKSHCDVDRIQFRNDNKGAIICFHEESDASELQRKLTMKPLKNDEGQSADMKVQSVVCSDAILVYGKVPSEDALVLALEGVLKDRNDPRIRKVFPKLEINMTMVIFEDFEAASSFQDGSIIVNGENFPVSPFYDYLGWIPHKNKTNFIRKYISATVTKSLSPLQVQFLSNKVGCDFIIDETEKQKWGDYHLDFMKNEQILTVTASSKNLSETYANYALGCMKTFEIDLDEAMLKSWKDKGANIKQIVSDTDIGNWFCFSDTETKLSILAASTEIAHIQQMVESFFNDNSLYNESIVDNEIYGKYLKKHYKNDLKEKCFGKVTFKFTTAGKMIASGTKSHLEKLKLDVKILTADLEIVQYLVQSPGMSNHFLTPSGIMNISSIADQTKTIIVNETEFSSKSLGATTSATGSTLEGTLNNNIKVCVIQGDITLQNVDAIINAANEDLKHIGGLAAAILKAGGQEIQSECDNYTKRHGPLSVSDLYISKAGNLTCKKIIHVVGPRWKGGNSEEPLKLRKAIMNCINAANGEKLLSIAIPAVSTKMFGYPAEKAIPIIVDAIVDACKDSKVVQEIRIVDTDNKTIALFCDKVSSVIGFQQTVGLLKVQPAPMLPSVAPKSAPIAHIDIQPLSVPEKIAVKQTGLSFNGCTINIVKDSIINCARQCNVLVNTTAGGNLLSVGATSKAIMDAAGASYINDIKKKYPSGLQTSTVGKTMAGQLSCQFVYHIGCPPWVPVSGEKILSDTVAACLTQLNQDSCTSIAFPAIGTGGLNYPAATVAKVMFDSVISWLKLNNNAKLKSILFVVFPSDVATVQQFENEYKSRTNIIEGSNLIQSTASTICSAIKIGSINVEVIEGDIIKEKTDCIICPSNNDLDLTRGQVAIALNAAGGKAFEALLQSSKSGNSSFKKGVLPVFTVNILPYKCVLFLDAPVGNPKLWHNVLNQALKEADKLNLVSVAVPALGTGHLNSNISEIADVMLKTIQTFATTKEDRNLKLIRIVIFQKATYDQFCKHLSTLIPQVENSNTPNKPEGIISKSWDWFARKLMPEVSSDSNNDCKDKSVPIKESQVEKNLLLFICGQKTNVLKAQASLDKSCDDNCPERTLTKDIISSLDPSTIAKFELEGEKFGVKLFVNLEENKIKIKGFHATDFQFFLTDKLDKIKDDLADAVGVKWFRRKNGYSPWDAITLGVSRLERAYKISSGRGCVPIEMEGDDHFSADFDSMAILSQRKNILYYLKRVDLEHIPQEWDLNHLNHREPDEYTSVKLDPKSEEYAKVSNAALSTATTGIILKIERIQNLVKYQQYMTLKRKMEQTLSKNAVAEKNLFHGTDAKNIIGICSNGFNRSLCGQNGTVYGQGSYFARDCSYSTPRYGKTVFFAKVLTGAFTQGNQNMKVSPDLDASKGTKYDSVVDNVANPSIFVVFSDNHAYPEYLITFG